MLVILFALACAPLDEEACLAVESDAACPTEDEASDLLVGTHTCEDPVREVAKTGALVERVTDEEGDACCYEAHYRVRHGETCIPEGATGLD